MIMSHRCLCSWYPDCPCPKVLAPVCGKDGVTYNNKCLAKCNNVVEFKCEDECGKCGNANGNGLHFQIRHCTCALLHMIIMMRNSFHSKLIDARHCFSGCAQCGKIKGSPSCCGKGGSWFQKCGRNNDPKFEHTWGEGVKACPITPSKPKSK